MDLKQRKKIANALLKAAAALEARRVSMRKAIRSMDLSPRMAVIGGELMDYEPGILDDDPEMGVKKSGPVALPRGVVAVYVGDMSAEEDEDDYYGTGGLVPPMLREDEDEFLVEIGRLFKMEGIQGVLVSWTGNDWYESRRHRDVLMRDFVVNLPRKLINDIKKQKKEAGRLF